MEKRTYLADTIAMALLYRKQYVGSEMISYDKVVQFDEMINKNLDAMNSTCGVGIRYDCYDNSELFIKLTDEEGMVYVVIDPNANLKQAWNFHIGCLPTDVLIAAQMSNALEIINLELSNGKLKNKLQEKESEKQFIKKRIKTN